MTRTALFSIALVFASMSVASAAPSSGMLLGIYAFPNSQGLRVTSTMPGYSADGKLFRHDVLVRVTADGETIYPTRSFQQFEFAKDQIGPSTPAALEVFRPGEGYIYLWVGFIPVGGQEGLQLRGQVETQARMWTQQERPGAERLFQGSGGPSGRRNSGRPNHGSSAGGAAQLFGGR